MTPFHYYNMTQTAFLKRTSYAIQKYIKVQIKHGGTAYSREEQQHTICKEIISGRDNSTISSTRSESFTTSQKSSKTSNHKQVERKIQLLSSNPY